MAMNVGFRVNAGQIRKFSNSLSILYLSVVRFPYQRFAPLLNITKARNLLLGNNVFPRHLRLDSILVHLLKFTRIFKIIYDSPGD